jgi:hypothetical protein
MHSEVDRISIHRAASARAVRPHLRVRARTVKWIGLVYTYSGESRCSKIEFKGAHTCSEVDRTSTLRAASARAVRPNSTRAQRCVHAQWDGSDQYTYTCSKTAFEGARTCSEVDRISIHTERRAHVKLSRIRPEHKGAAQTTTAQKWVCHLRYAVKPKFAGKPNFAGKPKFAVKPNSR